VVGVQAGKGDDLVELEVDGAKARAVHIPVRLFADE
jgi:hypothetical protein